ncbi:MAG: PilZ domain-containing protein [Candidatus Omnitrophota bacterium]
MYSGENRRKHKRVKKPAFVEFSVRERGAEDAWVNVAVLNIGMGGCLFYSKKAIKKNAGIEIRIDFEDKKKPLECAGKVLRVEKASPPIHLVAAVFEDLEEDKKKALTRIIG